jgi:signal peptidase II
MRKVLISILIFLAIIFLDQIIKYFVQQNLSHLVVLNEKGAWGILPSWVAWLGFIGIIVITIKEKYFSYALIAIAAAGVSNVLDRFLYGGVVDYIHVMNFPVFNAADAIITVGVLFEFVKGVKDKKL